MFSVDIRVFSFSIIVSLDYLMKIKDFFAIDNSSNKSVSQHVKNEPIVKKKQIVSPTKTMFTINIHIEKPDIILLEDMDDINSNCIILNVIFTLYFFFFYYNTCYILFLLSKYFILYRLNYY